MATSGFGALGEFALGETGELNDALVRVAVVESTAQLLPAATYVGQFEQRTTSGAWGEFALGEFALGEGQSDSTDGVTVEVDVIEAAAAAPLNPFVASGTSVLPGLIVSAGVPLAPAIKSGATVSPAVLESSGAALNPDLNISATVLIDVIGSSGTPLAPSLRSGASVQPAQYKTDRTGAWGEGALGEFAHGEGPPSLGQAHPIGAFATVLLPTISAGKAVVPAVVESSGQALTPLVSAGKSTFLSVVESTGELLNPELKISVSILPGVVESTGQKLAPRLAAGKSVLPSVIGSHGYFLSPELDARRRRLWIQAIAS